MPSNAEYIQEVGISGRGETLRTYQRTVVRNAHFMDLRVELNEAFRDNPAEQLVLDGEPMSAQEARIRDIVSWFEATVREWTGSRVPRGST